MTDEKEKLVKYATLKNLIKQYEDQLDEMKPEIIEIISRVNPDEDEHTVDVDGVGKFSCVQKRKYKYSVDVQVAEDKVKAMKLEEEQTGKAKYVVNPYLLYKGVVEE